MRYIAYIFSLLILSSPSFGQNNISKPFVLGVVEEIDSKLLSEKRTLNIYLPEGYNPSDTTKYPVIYLLDGSADEDFIHVVGIVQYNSFSWINRVPKSIVVGIANIDRARDYFFPTTVKKDKQKLPTSGGSGKFIAFIESELQPFINKKYKTNTDKTIIGQSAGGLLATEILFTKPTLFNRYLIVSPSLWWDNASILQQKPALLQPSFNQKTAIYIGVGKEGLAPTEESHVMEVDANLLAEKLINSQSKSVKVFFDYMPQENHGTSLHMGVFNAIRLLYPAPDSK